MSKSSKEEKSNTLKRSWFQELKGEFRKITWLDKSSLCGSCFLSRTRLYHSYRRLVDPDWFEFHSWVKDGEEYVRGRECKMVCCSYLLRI